MDMTTAGTAAPEALARRLESALAVRPTAMRAISGNYGIVVYRVETAAGRFAVKAGSGEAPGHLAIEAAMLRDLALDGSLPVPAVVHGEDDLLVLEWIDNDGGGIQPCHERAAGEMLARLHATPRPFFGYGYDTTIGGLAQPNPRSDDWVSFFRDARLLPFAREAERRGDITGRLLARIERLAARLGELLPEPKAPALVHGDAWFGNVLTRGETVAAFIDPAIHHASPEIELAYVTMHGTFGRPFFEAYAATAPIEPGFFEERLDLLNIYPNLVHAMLCGPGYAAAIARTLDRLGL